MRTLVIAIAQMIVIGEIYEDQDGLYVPLCADNVNLLWKEQITKTNAVIPPQVSTK
jgi:hypothetical protein